MAETVIETQHFVRFGRCARRAFERLDAHKMAVLLASSRAERSPMTDQGAQRVHLQIQR